MSMTTHTYAVDIQDIDSGLLRQRRNLIFVSLSLIIFNLAGGDIARAPTIFGAIDVSRPEYIVFGAWIALVYATWRYWLYTEPSIDAFNVDLRNAYKSSKKFRNLISEVRYDGVKNDFPIINYGLFSRSLDFSRSIESHKKIGTLKREYVERTFENYPQVPVPYLRFFWVEVFCKLKAMTIGRSFSDYLLPYLLAVFAVISGLIDWVLAT